MRRILSLVPVCWLVTGCDLGPPPVFAIDTGDTGVPCAQEGWVATTTASLQIPSLQLDAGTLLAGFDPTAEYPNGPAACADPSGGGAAWIFEVDGKPFGMLTVQADRAGSLNLGQEGSVQFDMFGAESPVTFTNADYVLGGWNVGTLSPTFTSTLSALQAQQTGRLLSGTFIAEATL